MQYLNTSYADFKKRNRKIKIKILLILFTIVCIPIIIFVSIYFSTNGKERHTELQKVKKLYKDIFVKKQEYANPLFLSKAMVEQVKQIYLDFKDSSYFEEPQYHVVARVLVTKQGLKTIYQFTDYDFTKGSSIYSKWNNIVVITTKEGLVVDMGYKNA